MKINNTFLFNIKVIISCLILCSYSLKVRNIKSENINLKDPLFNQLFDYPNTYEAPTSSDQIPKVNYTAPLLSHSLFEEDPRRKLRQKDFVSTIRYSMYNMTRGEIEQIFLFADMNRDDLIDQNEWDAFTALFVFPFEACDSDGDYLLDLEDFKKCYDADPRSKLVNFIDKYQEKKHELIMDLVSTRGKNMINFSDYLVIRRALFGWKECQSTSMYISMSAFKCAIKVAVPQKYHLKVDYERIYNTGIKLNNDPGMVELEFISYLRVLYFTYVFSIYSSPQDIPFIDKVQFMKAVKEDRFPTGFSEREVDYIFEMINTSPFLQPTPMNFESFCFIFNMHRLFMKYSKVKPLQININELGSLMDDILFPLTIRFSIDTSITYLDKPSYLEASVILQRLRINERDFYYSFKSVDNGKELNKTLNRTINHKNPNNSSFFFKFKQDNNSPKELSSNYYQAVPKNDQNRYYFYLTMAGADKLSWTKQIYYRAFILANFFTEMIKDQRFVVSVSNLLDDFPNLYDSVNPPISLMQRDNYLFWKNVPREAHVDIISFVALENYRNKFDLHKLNKLELINETLLKVIMKDYGWSHMPDTVIDLAKRGYDQLRRRMYNPSEAFKYMMITHVAASENKRMKEYQKRYSLELNNDPSRKFLPFPRRFASSIFA